MDEDFAWAVEDDLKLSKRLVLFGGRPRPAPSFVDLAAVDSPDVNSYQPHVYGRLDPP